MSAPLFSGTFLLQRMPGKGGWTFIVLPGVPKEKRGRFNSVTVSGRIDKYELKEVNLMAVKTGELFMPVKTEIRKHIGKEAGDTVELLLYSVHEPVDIRAELIACLEDEPVAYRTFLSHTEAEQNALIEWIRLARDEDMKVERIARVIDRLEGE